MNKDLERIREILQNDCGVKCKVEVGRFLRPNRSILRLKVTVPLNPASDIEVLKSDFEKSVTKVIGALEANYKLEVVGPIRCDIVQSRTGNLVDQT